MRLRRTLLYVPGNRPGLIQAALVCGADVVTLDLEDSVAPDEKDAARHLVAEAIRFLPWEDSEIAVRVNSPSTGLLPLDVKATVKAGVRLVRVPKIESARDVQEIDAMLAGLERELEIPAGTVKMTVSIESARGLLASPSIAAASPRLEAMSLGGEDFTEDLGAVRSREGDELTYARLAVLSAARAAGLDAIDTVFSDVSDDEGLAADAARARRLGFDGKSVISPRQIPIVAAAFRPSAQEVAEAQAVVRAARQALSAGSGVASLGGRMVDAPIIKRAERVLAMAGREKGRRADADKQRD